MFRKNLANIFLLLIILLAGFLRFYQLGNIPSGLTNDEANKGYEAYSILLTGKDQWNNFLPITNFKSFGDYPPPGYIYLTVPSVFLFGLNQFSVRFVSAFFGLLSVIALYFLGRKLFNAKMGILIAFFMAIFPWAIGLSRIGIESNVAIFFTILALILGLGETSKKSIYISFVMLALAVYTYSGYMLFAPIIMIFILIYRFDKKIKYQDLIKPIILFLILILPLFLNKGSASVRFSQVGLTNNISSIGLIDTLNTERGQCLGSLSPFVCKIVDNKPILFVSTFLKNYLAHFSTNFIYMNGTHTQYSILQQRGLDYIFSVVFLIFGLYYLLKKNKNSKISLILIGLFLLSAVPDSLTGEGNYSRASIMQPFIVLLNGLGLSFLIYKFELIKNKKIGYSLLAIVFLTIFFSLISFFISYSTYFKNNYSVFSEYGYQDLMTRVNMEKNKFDRIYISSHFNDTKQYIYFLFYNKYSPVKYQSKKDVSYSQDAGSWISIDRLENIYFISSIIPLVQEEELRDKKILVISSPKDFPKTITPFFVIKDKLGNVLFEAIILSDLIEYDKANKSKADEINL